MKNDEENTESKNNKRLIKLREVLKMFPVSKSAWYRGIKDGIYPENVKIGQKAVAWRLSDIEKLTLNGVNENNYTEAN